MADNEERLKKYSKNLLVTKFVSYFDSSNKNKQL